MHYIKSNCQTRAGNARTAKAPSLAKGNLRLVDRTLQGASLRIATGVDREEPLTPWFSRHLPRDPWRQLTVDEREALECPTADFSRSNLVAVDFPKRIYDEFWESYVGRIFSSSSSVRQEARDQFQAFLLQHIGFVGGSALLEVHSFKIFTSTAGSRSTSFDLQTGQFAGLHIDEHPRGLQSLCLNLGHAERHLHFVNRNAASLLRSIGGRSALPEHAPSAASLVQAFFSAFPDTPVLRLTIQPGQGYLGPTQDFIHDGSTNDQGRLDVNLQIIGLFKSAKTRN